MEDKSSFKFFTDTNKKKVVQNFDLDCLYRAEKGIFFTPILYKKEENHVVDCFPGTS